MQITDAGIEQYIDQHTSPASGILHKIERETYVKSIYPRMLSGKVQGKFLRMVSNMIKPTNILEVGTFTGYSAVSLAEGLGNNGRLYTIEINEELKLQNEAYFEEADMADKIVAYFGNALDIIPQLGIQFDLVFIDADKINYCRYYELCMDKVKTGGFILADNVLWSGKVLMEKISKTDKDTLAVKKFNELVQNDKRVENVMIPLRDGLTLIQKIC
ncbi:MAG: O-methyltransferase [Cytophagales bacterium]|nr:O-methyltransferase [Cytophagales bacterium]